MFRFMFIANAAWKALKKKKWSVGNYAGNNFCAYVDEINISPRSWLNLDFASYLLLE